MPATTLTNRSRNVFPSDHLAVAILRYDNDDRQRHARRFEVRIRFNLSCYVIVSKCINHAVDVGPQPLVIVPWDTTGDREFRLPAQEVATHVQ